MRDLNFFTSYIGKEKETKTNFICQVILPCLGVLFVVCTFGFNKIYTYSLNKAIEKCNNEISSRQEQIDKVEIQKKKYDILNRTSIGELQYNLRALQYVNDVQLINVSEEKSNGNYEFSIKCTLKDDDKNEGK